MGGTTDSRIVRPGVGRGRAYAWTPAQERFLSSWWGLRPDAWVAARLGRTPAACKIRATRFLGQARRDNLLPARRVGAIFGVDPTTPVRVWLARGWVGARRMSRGAGGRRRTWDFAEVLLRRFVVERPWAYDVRRMEPGHWLTLLAQEVAAADPWLTLAEAAAVAHLVPGTLWHWVAKGWLPAERRPRYGAQSGPRGGHWVVRRAALLEAMATHGDRGGGRLDWAA